MSLRAPSGRDAAQRVSALLYFIKHFRINLCCYLCFRLCWVVSWQYLKSFPQSSNSRMWFIQGNSVVAYYFWATRVRDWGEWGRWGRKWTHVTKRNMNKTLKHYLCFWTASGFLCFDADQRIWLQEKFLYSSCPIVFLHCITIYKHLQNIYLDIAVSSLCDAN